MLIHTNFRAIFWSAECQVIAVSTKEYFQIYLRATQMSTTISQLNCTLCFTGINMANMKVTTEMNGILQVSIVEAGFVLAEFGPQALSTF